jgi:hypothetical protein
MYECDALQTLYSKGKTEIQVDISTKTSMGNGLEMKGASAVITWNITA